MRPLCKKRFYTGAGFCRVIPVARRNANTNQPTKMKTLAANHPIKIALSRYLAENTGAAWERFAVACTSRGIDPEVIIQRYCH